MNPTQFPEQTQVIAKDQPEYQPLPAFRFAHDPTGRAVFRWQLTWRERFSVFFTGKLWHTVLTFNAPLQPQLLGTQKPFTPEDVAAAAAARAAVTAEKEFTDAMFRKYGHTAEKKTAHMDALNYHPNDRRRVIKFDPQDFARARELGLLFLHRCRIIEDSERGGVAETRRSSPVNEITK